MNYLEIIIVWFCITIIVFSSAVYGQTAEELYQQGVQYEEITGDLEKAIDAYEAALKKVSSSKKTAALAQLHLGLCYEKLGRNNLDKAIEAFHKVIDNYPDQKELIDIAKERLAANDTSEKDIFEIKKAIEEHNRAFETKNADLFASFYSKVFFQKGLLGKQTGDPVRELKEWVNNKYFSKWKKIKIDYIIKSINKIGYTYQVNQDWNVIVTDWNDTEIVLERAADAYETYGKEDGTWKILSTVVERRLPEAYQKIKEPYKYAGKKGLVYVSHITQNFISVIDPESNTLVDMVPSQEGSTSVSISDSLSGYITNYHSNTLSVFNKLTGWEIATVQVGEHPTNTLLTPDESFLIIMHESFDGMWVMNTHNNQIIKKDRFITGNMEIHPLGKKIYSPAIFKPVVYVLDPSTQNLINEIPVGGRPMNIAFSSDGKYAYVPNFDLNEVEIIDTETDSVVKRIPNIKDGRGVAVSKDDKYLYVTNVVSNSVTIIDLKTDSILKIIPVGNMPTFAAVSLDNKFVYISNQGASSISVIDTNTNEVVKIIEVADNPITVQVD